MSAISIAPQFDRTDRYDARPARRRTELHAVQRPAQGQVRLTRRGRLTVFLGTLGMLLVASFAFGAGAVGSEKPGTPPPSEIVVVGPGETLWGIAAENAGDREVREVMTAIEELNALESAGLMVGQRLRVPLDTDR